MVRSPIVHPLQHRSHPCVECLSQQDIAQRRMLTAENVVHNVCGTRSVGHQVVVRGHRSHSGRIEKENKKNRRKGKLSIQPRQMRLRKYFSTVEPLESHPTIAIFPYLLVCYGHTFPGRVSLRACGCCWEVRNVIATSAASCLALIVKFPSYQYRAKNALPCTSTLELQAVRPPRRSENNVYIGVPRPAVLQCSEGRYSLQLVARTINPYGTMTIPSRKM